MQYNIKQEAFEVYGKVVDGAIDKSTLSAYPVEGLERLIMAESMLELSDEELLVARHFVTNPDHPEAMSTLRAVFRSQAMAIIKELKERGISIHTQETVH